MDHVSDQEEEIRSMESHKGILSNDKMKYFLSADDKYTRNNPIFFNFTLQNLSNEDLWILVWHTPLEGLRGKIFHVTCDGMPVSYEGLMVKRGEPTKSDYIHISPNHSISAAVD